MIDFRNGRNVVAFGPSRVCKLRALNFIAGLFVCLGAMLAAPVAAQQSVGRVIGTVVEEESGQPLIGATVMIVGTQLGARADLDGKFTIRNVPPGTYTLRVSAIGYAPVEITEVIVEASGEKKLDVSMTIEAVQGETITVTASAIRNSEAAQLKDRQEAADVRDAISSETMERQGAGDAAEAASKAVGVSVVEGKEVVVRGLGDRYGNVTLNSALLPTPDPEKQAVPLDLIPAGMLDNVVITKTFTPDKPGNFAGGSVDLQTKDFPDKRSLSVSVGSGYNDRTTGTEGFFTFERGISTSPPIWNEPFAREFGTQTPGFTTDSAVAQQVSNVSTAFPDHFRRNSKDGRLPGSFSASYGDNLLIADRRLGFNVAYRTSRSASFYDDGQINSWLARSQADSMEARAQYNDTRAVDENFYSFLGNAAVEVTPNNRFTFSYVWNKSEEWEGRRVYGVAPGPVFDDLSRTDGFLDNNVLAYTERSLQAIQFGGKHVLHEKSRFRVDWRYSRSKAEQDEPDHQFFSFEQYFPSDEDPEPTPFGITTANTAPPERFFRFTEEENREFGADVAMNVSRRILLKTGYLEVRKDRDVEQDSYVYSTNSLGAFAQTGQFEDFFAPIGAITQSGNFLFINRRLSRVTTPRDEYTGTQDVTAGYAMGDIRVTDWLRLVGGARYEETEMTAENGFEPDSNGYLGGSFVSYDWLPAIAITVSPSTTVNIRAAYAQTLARPTIREFAPFGSEEFGNSERLFIGNPDLKRTLIRNHDVRLEWFPRPGEVLAVSAFHKRLEDPIVLTIRGAAAEQRFPLNVDEGSVFGAEFEIRKRLDQVSNTLRNFEFGANLTLTTSEIDLDPGRATDLGVESSDRPMFGQSDYIVNVSLGFNPPTTGTSLNLSYNVFGERLDAVGTGVSPDIYEQPRNLLDFNASQRLPGGLKFKFAISNMLDERNEFAQEWRGVDYIDRLYGSGRSFSVGLGWSL